MKYRIFKSEMGGRDAFFPQYKPNILIQALQLNFDWRFFHVVMVTEVNNKIRYFRDLDAAIRFIESGACNDQFSTRVVWESGKGA